MDNTHKKALVDRYLVLRSQANTSKIPTAIYLNVQETGSGRPGFEVESFPINDMLSKYDGPEIVERVVDEIEKRDGWLIEIAGPTGLEIQEMAFEQCWQTVLLFLRKTLRAKNEPTRVTA